MQTHQYVHTKTHEHIYVYVCSGISDVTQFSPSSEVKINDFGGLCLTNAHLAFRPKGFSRRFVPQNDIGYAFTLLHLRILPHLRITSLPLMVITTTPYYHVRNRDADE